MTRIERSHANPRLSRIVRYGDIVYFAGITAADRTQDVAGQTRQILDRIDAQLAEVGSDKSRLLSVQLILRHVEQDIDLVNGIWETWLDGHPVPARAAWGGQLVKPDVLLEAVVSAAA